MDKSWWLYLLLLLGCGLTSCGDTHDLAHLTAPVLVTNTDAVTSVVQVSAAAGKSIASATPTILPYLTSLRQKGFNLSDTTTFNVVYSQVISGQVLQIVKYQFNNGNALQIFDKTGQILDEANPENSALILILINNYVVNEPNHQMSTPLNSRLRQLLTALQNYRAKDAPFAEFASVVKPLLTEIDRLKQHNTKVPVLGTVSLFDAVCLVPVTLANLCLLEPLAQLIESEAPALDQALVADIKLIQQLLTLAGQPQQDGLQLRDLLLRTAAACDQLQIRLDSLDIKALTGKDIGDKVSAKIQNSQVLRLTGAGSLFTTLSNQSSKFDQSIRNLSEQTDQAREALLAWRDDLGNTVNETIGDYQRHP